MKWKLYWQLRYDYGTAINLCRFYCWLLVRPNQNYYSMCLSCGFYIMLCFEFALCMKGLCIICLLTVCMIFAFLLCVISCILAHLLYFMTFWLVLALHSVNVLQLQLLGIAIKHRVLSFHFHALLVHCMCCWSNLTYTLGDWKLLLTNAQSVCQFNQLKHYSFHWLNT